MVYGRGEEVRSNCEGSRRSKMMRFFVIRKRVRKVFLQSGAVPPTPPKRGAGPRGIFPIPTAHRKNGVVKLRGENDEIYGKKVGSGPLKPARTLSADEATTLLLQRYRDGGNGRVGGLQKKTAANASCAEVRKKRLRRTLRERFSHL